MPMMTTRKTIREMKIWFDYIQFKFIYEAFQENVALKGRSLEQKQVIDLWWFSFNWVFDLRMS